MSSYNLLFCLSSAFCALHGCGLFFWSRYINIILFQVKKSKIRHEDFRPSDSSLTLVLPPLKSENGLDWRALVESRPHDIGKLR